MTKNDDLTLARAKPYDPLAAAFEMFLLSREAMRCTPKTLEHYTYTVGNFANWLRPQGVNDPRQITANHIRMYLVGLQKRGLKDTTQHVHARGIKAWLNWLVREGELDDTPMRNVPMPRLEKRIPLPFDRQDVERLLAACDRSTVDGLRNYAIVLGLLDSGLRLSEFAALRLGDINMRTGLVTVMGKGGKQRQVRFGAKARAAIVKYAGAAGLALGDKLWGLKPVSIKVMLSRLGERVGVQPCSAHRFRRTFAITLLRQGCDLHSLRLLMGHSGLAVLQRYLALGAEDMMKAHRLHSPGDHWLERR